MGDTRAELRWTKPGKDEDEEFMMQLLPEYNEIHAQGAMRKKNPQKRAFINATLDKYRKRWPGRVESWDLSKIGTGGSTEDRERRYYQVSQFDFNCYRDYLLDFEENKRLVSQSSFGRI